MSENTRAFGSATRGWINGRGTWMAPALAAAALVVGTAGPARAAEPELKLNHVWGGCVLGEGGADTAGNLLLDIEASSPNDPPTAPNIDPDEIAFVLVYSLNNDNDGQPANVDGAGTTGPVLCVNGDLVDITMTTQTANIPPSGTANFLDVEDVFIVQYELADETIEKVLCHTVNDNTDCFRIFPLPD